MEKKERERRSMSEFRSMLHKIDAHATVSIAHCNCSVHFYRAMTIQHRQVTKLEPRCCRCGMQGALLFTLAITMSEFVWL